MKTQHFEAKSYKKTTKWLSTLSDAEKSIYICVYSYKTNLQTNQLRIKY